ncbi:carboxylating nicotinate-nucleotide diphosphorylase [Clostridium sp. SYSU_GA19001]|uniref:carboxylating nicotinate-nucleotide diphosphorylase n=1 Tax=Clostridium caldaquaticum TaxID=2940653 RepID=UPI002076F65E|nr:carboxylating nicotinate-nucleotide diphosphorylase [Clostridium caldaquaticum]MCM8709864.1 carboxylating nicotinate-nucleotide diphosphorylase [Clostridium caldaquaticum]
MNYLIIDKYLIDALKEDIPNEDITTNSVIDESSNSIVDLIAKEEGIIAGLKVFERVFCLLGKVDVEFYKKDGDEVKPGDLVASIKGNTRNILMGERTALNFLQRMSGIATITRKFTCKLNGTSTKLLDTRKTTPNMRIFEKYSVKVGGGCNHRFNLSDGVLLKDNHISAAGGVKKAIQAVRDNASFVRRIEVEVENLDMVKEAIEAGADIIMLDNMDFESIKKAVEIVGKRAVIEVSGNVNLQTIESIAKIGVDYISTGAITHSAGILDLSMKNLRNL